MKAICIIDEERISVDVEDKMLRNDKKYRSFSLQEKELEDEVTKFLTTHNQFSAFGRN